jgi:hypothetical protein
MNEKELLNLFLGTFPDSTHPKDRGRFISYAIECARNSHYIDIKAMSEKGLDQERIEELEIAFEWIRDTMDYLSSKGTP